MIIIWLVLLIFLLSTLCTIDIPFKHSMNYIKRVNDHVTRAWTSNRAIYDMDYDDEE